MYLKLCCYLYVIVIVLYSLFILFKYTKFLKKNNINIDDALKENKGLFIAIPCLREQKIIENTIKHFKSICDLPIVIITTRKEDFECGYDKNYETTKMIVEKNILNKYNDVYLINYPFESGYMADQLNYMIHNLKSMSFYDDTKEWYMSLYNADSKLSIKTFKSIYYYINKDKKVIQQYSYCFKNFEKLGFITKGFAIYQSNFEIKVGLFNSKLHYRYLYNYVVGHGLTIKLKTLKEMGNFNTKFWCEDIYLTMKLKYNNVELSSVPYLENIENAISVKQIVKQNSVWYNTTRKNILIYKDIKKEEGKYSFFGLIGCINEFRCAVNWLFFPIIFVINILISMFLKSIFIFTLLLISYLFYAFINYIITINTINKFGDKSCKRNISNYISYVMALLISNVGPINSLMFKKKEKYKTER